MKLIDTLLNVVAPHQCIRCGEEGSVLCDICILDACQPLPSRCYRCKKLTSDFAVCPACRKVSSLHNIWVRAEYGKTTKELIYQLKFHSNRSAATVIAQLVAEVLPILPDNTVITHVPTATARRRQRSFDHARLIAKELSRLVDVPYSDVIGRSGKTRQVGASRELRLKQLNGAFYLKKDITSGHVLLVDDIVTTGGTLESAALVLKKSGAKKIYAITFAQK